MCSNRVRSVVDAATLRVVLIIAAALAGANSEFSDDFYSGQEILIIGPHTVPQNFWSRGMLRGKSQGQFNDPSFGIVPTSRGYHRSYGGPWVLVKHSPKKMAGLTKQSSSKIPYKRFNAEDKAMSSNFRGYGRRSATGEMSSAEKEYQAVRRALARDRVQPMRRSMMPKVGKKLEDKTVEDLLPFMMKLASLIEKLDSRNGAVRKYGENRVGKTKERVISLLRDVISGLQKDVENIAKGFRIRANKAKEKLTREYNMRRGNFDDGSSKFNHNSNSNDSIKIDHSDSGIKNNFSSVTRSLESSKESKENHQDQSKNISEVEKTLSASSMMQLPDIKSLNSTDKNGKPEFRTGLNDPEFFPRRFIDAAKMNEENTATSADHFSKRKNTPIGLVPEHRAFDRVAVEGQGLTEDAETSVELVNRAFDDVTPSRSKRIAKRTGI